MVEAVAQHRLGEAARLVLEFSQFFRRALGRRPREGLELDLGGGIETARHRAQRVGEALLLPAVGFAKLTIEKIQRVGECAGEPFEVLGSLHHFLHNPDAGDGVDMGGKL